LNCCTARHSFTCKLCCWSDGVLNRELRICEICLLDCFQEAGKIYVYLAYLYLFIKLFLNTRALLQSEDQSGELGISRRRCWCKMASWHAYGRLLV